MSLDPSIRILSELSAQSNLSEGQRQMMQTHLRRIVGAIEMKIRSHDLDNLMPLLKHLFELDQKVDFAKKLDDYQGPYFVCINLAYIIQQ